MIFTEEYINTQKIVYTLLNRPDGVDFIEIMRGLEIKSDKVKYPNSIFFFKDGLWYFELSTASGDLWCRYDKVWSVFTDKHNKVYSEIKAFIQEMVKEHWLRNIESWGTHFSSDFTEVEDNLDPITSKGPIKTKKIDDHFNRVAGPHPNCDMGEIDEHFNIQREEESYKGEIIPTAYSGGLSRLGIDKHFKDKNLTKVSPKGAINLIPKWTLKQTAKQALEIDEHFKGKEINATLDWQRPNEEHLKVEDHFKEVNPKPYGKNIIGIIYERFNLEKHFKEVNPRQAFRKRVKAEDHFNKKNTQPEK